MSDNESKEEKIRQIYRYDEMSNKVLQKDCRLNDIQSDPSRDAELSQPKSVKGRITLREMGIGLGSNKSSKDKDIEDEDKRRAIEESISVGSDDRTPTNNIIQKKSVLEMTETQSLKYSPSNKHNSDIYDSIISWCCKLLGDDLPDDILLGTVDIVICEIKENESDMNANQLRQKIQNELSLNINESLFHDILLLVKEIDDFGFDKDNTSIGDRIVNVVSDAEEEENTIFDGGNINIGSEMNGQFDQMNDPDTKSIFEEPELIHFKGSLSTIDSEISPLNFTKINLKQLLNDYTNDLDIDDCCSKIIAASASNDNQFVSTVNDILGQHSNPHFISLISKNKSIIYWLNKFVDSKNEEKESILNNIADSCSKDLADIVRDMFNKEDRKRPRENDADEELEGSNGNGLSHVNKKATNNTLSTTDLENIAQVMMIEPFANVEKVTLPEGSFKRVKELHEEIHIPAPKKPDFDIDLVEISSLPIWAQQAFPVGEMSTLNYIQSKVYDKAFNNSDNLLMCAPTGAGKTNVAVLTILHALNSVQDDKGNFNLKKLKMVYVAPLKALVQEQVRETQRRLESFGVKVSELTGDTTLTRKEITDSHLLITTPEKWDILTRKNDETDILRNLRLIIIDEVHLLHDQRGPVIESIVARTTSNPVTHASTRIVALSATLPNYDDVACFLKVPKSSTFFFDSSYRPCPLSQIFCAIKDNNAAKKITTMNQICFEKAVESLQASNQVIIFVHSRKDTIRTAKFISELIDKDESLREIFFTEPNAKNILNKESKNCVNSDLQSILKNGIGIHHAGLSRTDRSLSEDLFADGILRVLVSTATLAWGVNLPAHTVIVKGTDIYSPEVGDWIRLSAQDMLQMLGRAGRPRYDTYGEGVIITNQKDLQYYLAILNQQLPIESQLLSKFIDNLNAEIVLGSIKRKEDAIAWLAHTYFYVRLCSNPDLYIPEKCRNNADDNTYSNLRNLLVDAALQILQEKLLIYVDERNQTLKSTKLGQIASHFYISYNSVHEYFKKINEKTTQVDMFKIFSESEEFKYVTCKREEQNELKELFQKAPVPISGSLDEAPAKINVLLQAYISRIALEGFALSSDMIFVTQNAGRLFAAIREICLSKNNSLSTKIAIEINKSVTSRMWPICTPLRHFPSCPKDIIKRVEVSTLPWSHYLTLTTPTEVGSAIRSEKNGKLVFDLLKRYPRINVACVTQTITPSMLLLQIEFTAEFTWDRKLHGFAEPFSLIVEDINGEKIFHYERFLLKSDEVNKELPFSVPITLQNEDKKRLPPNFFVSVISEKWLQCNLSIPLSLENIKVPKKFPSKNKTPLEQLELKNIEYENIKKWFTFRSFNNIQCALFEQFYNTNENILLCAAANSGKTTLAELAIISHFEQAKGRAVYIGSNSDKINSLQKQWRTKLLSFNSSLHINKLGSDPHANLKIFNESHLILATPEQFEYITRRWRQRKSISTIELIIYDDIQEIGQGHKGINYEILASRLNFMITQLNKNCRQIAIGRSLANPSDIAGWLNISKEFTYNYDCTDSTNPMSINIFDYSNILKGEYNKSMILKSREVILKHINSNDKIIVVLNSKRGVFEMANEIKNAIDSQNKTIMVPDEVNIIEKIQNELIKKFALLGIGLLFEGIDDETNNIISSLYKLNQINILLVTKNSSPSKFSSDHIIILGTSYFDFVEETNYHYSVNEIIDMISGPTNGTKNVTILTDKPRKTLYKKFLTDGLPLESFLYQDLTKLLLVEISINTVKTKQECLDMLTYTYFYRRIHNNPSFYGLNDSTALSISAFLTEVIENTVTELKSNNLIEYENEGTIKITPISKIGLHHNLAIPTLSYLIANLHNKLTMSDMINILSNADEFSLLFQVHDGLRIFKNLSKTLPLKFTSSIEENTLSFKCFILLQCHFSRLTIPEEFKPLQQTFLSLSLNIVNAMVDILASFGYLNAMNAMDLSQMIIQGVWDIDSPLKQIPFFDGKMIEQCKNKNIESVYDIMEMEDDDRDKLLKFAEPQLIEIADFVNNYPNVEITYEFDESIIDENNFYSIRVKLIKDDLPDSLAVKSRFFKETKYEQWWIVIGESLTRSLFAIKKVTLAENEQIFDLKFATSDNDHHNISIWAICDSYLDVDKEVSFELEGKLH